MIPLKLELYNFMPYVDPSPLDFSGIHVACLSGDNGAGKSALLDAITWAVWGKTRARRDDELIHQGQAEMSVKFTFELDHTVYRVVRARRGGSRGQSALDLQVQAPDGTFRSIAGGTIRETQAEITARLRLDYDTFINSSFLLQNRADEFTLKTPAQRKQVLADILGLGKWESYEERAKQHIRAIEEHIRLADSHLQEIDDEIARRPQYEGELRDAQQAALGLADALHQAEEALHQLQQARLERRSIETQLADLQARIARAQDELERIQAERSAVQARLAELGRLLDEREHVEAGYAALKQARAAHDALSAKLGQLVQLNERKGELEAAIADARRALETELQLAAQAVAELEKRMADLALEAELEQVQAELKAAQACAAQAEAGRAQLASLAQDTAERRAQNATLKRDMDALVERINAIQAAGAVCPTCQRALGEEERARLLDEWQAHGKTLGDAWRANKASIEQAAAQQDELEVAIAWSEAGAQPQAALLKQLAGLEARYQLALDAVAAIEDRRAQHAALLEQMASQDYARASGLQAQLDELFGELAALGYDAGEHQRLRGEIERLAEFEQHKAQLDSAQASLADARRRLDELAEAEARWCSTLQADRARQAQLLTQAHALQQQLAGAGQVQEQVSQARGRERIARERVGAAQQKLAACDALARQKETRLAEREQLACDQDLYEELRTAFGKKGVPALIIEASLPEIEDEANALLARITAGRLHVRFDTQRESVKGDTLETLDIKIADELGTRPYENFSGGEQTRVNFAIRIALSKLLARRAGAQLQTLVIDEGFGALDASGRERLVEAIHAIQDDFARIIVITHIDELRDVFPVHIEVTKTPNGSHITVV